MIFNAVLLALRRILQLDSEEHKARRTRTASLVRSLLKNRDCTHLTLEQAKEKRKLVQSVFLQVDSL
jgi:hypothetical protein